MPSPKSPAQTQQFFAGMSTCGVQSVVDRSCVQRYGHFPELSIEQNRVIWEAREKGWDVFFVEDWFPTQVETANKTYLLALHFLKGAK